MQRGVDGLPAEIALLRYRLHAALGADAPMSRNGFWGLATKRGHLLIQGGPPFDLPPLTHVRVAGPSLSGSRQPRSAVWATLPGVAGMRPGLSPWA